MISKNVSSLSDPTDGLLGLAPNLTNAIGGETYGSYLKKMGFIANNTISIGNKTKDSMDLTFGMLIETKAHNVTINIGNSLANST